MKLSDLTINPENHHLYDPEDRYDKEALNIHTQINEYISISTGGIANGGDYMAFLRTKGIDGQSENGWWSVEAVDPENIELFVSQFQTIKTK